MNESIVKAVKEMIEAPSCCPELETAGEIWLESLGTREPASWNDTLVIDSGSKDGYMYNRQRI